MYLNIFFFFIILLLLVYIVYVKSKMKIDTELEDIFKNFLIMEKTLTDTYGYFYHYLCSELRKTFYACGSLFFVVRRNTIKLESYSNKKDYQFRNFQYQIDDNLEIDRLEVVQRIQNETLDDDFIYTFLKSKDKVILYPIFYQGNLHSVFFFFYSNRLTYMLASYFLQFNKNKLSEILVDIITVLQEKQQNINVITMEKLRDYALVTTDAFFNITSWNKGAEIMFGYSLKESLNTNFLALLDTEDMDDFQRAIEISEKKEETSIKIKIFDCNKTPIITEILLKRITVEKLSSGFYILIKNITKEEIWKNNIKKQSLINKSIVENTRDAIILLNEEDKVLFFNEKFRNVVGQKVNILGINIDHIFTPKYSRLIMEKISQIKRSLSEIGMLNFKMDKTWYSVRLFPIVSNEKYSGIIIFFIDNTLMMSTTEKLEKMTKSLLDNVNSAKRLQYSLIPSDLPNTKDIIYKSVYIPSYTMGGDYYFVDKVNIGEKTYYVNMVADVSGHGVEAAMLSVFVKDVYFDYIMDIEERNVLRPSQFLQMLNKKIINLEMDDKFITVFFSILDLDNMKLLYSSAGHPKALVIREKSDILSFGIENSPATGMFGHTVYRESEIEIQKKDKILFFTDGITDSFDEVNESFIGFIEQNRNSSIDQIKKKIELRFGAEENKLTSQDDITILMMKIKG